MIEALQFEFMRNAFIAAVLASICCGVIGVYIVFKRMLGLSGGIAHAAFGGIGLGYFLGVNPLWTVLPFSIASALGIGFVSRRSRLPEDTTIGIFWSIGMALGIILIKLTPGYAPDLFGYLFGNILTVSMADIWLMLVLDILIVLIVVWLYNDLLSFSFDEDFARVSGVSVNFLYYALLCLVALSVVMLIKVVGMILVIALMTLPVAIAKQYTHSFKKTIYLSIVFGIVFTAGGIWVSYAYNLATGATIILTLGFAFLLSSIYKSIPRQFSKTNR